MTSEEIRQAGKPEENNNAGDKPSEESIIERANKAAERLEQINKRFEENLAKQEQQYAKQILSGRSEAGRQIIPETPEQTAEKQAKELLKKYYG